MAYVLTGSSSKATACFSYAERGTLPNTHVYN
jgi:hypothetical protein